MTVIADTGALVALIDPDTREHGWACEVARRSRRPFLTSEPVLAEAAFILARDGFDADALFALADTGSLLVGIDFNGERSRLRELMRRYRNVPMSLADATLVRMSERHRDSRIWTLDSDFLVYRRHGNKTIPLLMPGA